MTFVRRAEYNILKDISHPHIAPWPDEIWDCVVGHYCDRVFGEGHVGRTWFREVREGDYALIHSKENRFCSLFFQKYGLEVVAF